MKRLVGTVLLSCVAAMLLASTGGCQLGPSKIQSGRAAYNMAVQQTTLEERLLNLVRLRYRDAPMFMELSSITTSFDFSVSGSISGDLGDADGDILGLGAGAVHSERPTITYTPLGGETFVKQLMRPVNLDTIVLLLYSGWSFERVMRTCLQGFGGLSNAPTASGPTPDMEPQWREFAEVASLFEVLRTRRTIRAGRNTEIVDAQEIELVLEPGPLGVDSEEARRIRELMGVPPNVNRFRLIPSYGLEVSGDTAIVGVSTRSLLGIFYYASHSTDVPQRDVERGLVTVTRTQAGETFDWRELLDPIMTIRFSEKRPRDAYVAVRYRGGWYYIADWDLNSKSTLSLIGQVAELAAGDVKSETPVLTIPVR